MAGDSKITKPDRAIRRCARYWLDGHRRPAGQVIAELKAGVLRGRGGAGFPTGLEVEFHAASVPWCRSIWFATQTRASRVPLKTATFLRYNPHIVIEGMVIAAYAMGITRRLQLHPR
jgi:NADH-quinone oxidoreductase subunit F